MKKGNHALEQAMGDLRNAAEALVGVVERGEDRDNRDVLLRAASRVNQALASSPPVALDVELPRIVCICGSTRFAAHMNTEAERLTLAGAIVVRPEVIAYSRERDQQFVEPEVKAALDVLHLRKIDLADEVVIVTVDGYIGESTRREIEYAERIGKPVGVVEYGSAER